MVRKIIRIYKVHDADLFWLIEQYEFNFPKAMYCALTGYLHSDNFLISLPPKREVPLNIRKKHIERNLILDDDKDAELIQFISNFPKGFTNIIMKNILRMYLCTPINRDWAIKSNLAIQGNRRRADAASYNKSRKKKDKKRTKKYTSELKQQVVKSDSTTVMEENVQQLIQDVTPNHIHKENDVSEIISEDVRHQDDEITSMFQKMLGI